MISELFSIGGLSISPFGVMLVVALFGAYFQLRWGLRYLRIGDEDDANGILLAAALGGILGGKLYYALLYQDLSLLFSRAGLVWYGSFLVGTAAVLWTIHRRRLPLWSSADAAAPALALGYSLGRIGCLLVGDDYGVPTRLPWGMKFPVGPIPSTAGQLRTQFGVEIPGDVPATEVIAVHPTQIYETLAAFVIFLVGRRLLKSGLRPGGVVLPVVALLSVERFLVEFLRAKDDRLLGVFTVAQLIAVLVLIVLAFLATRRPDLPATRDVQTSTS